MLFQFFSRKPTPATVTLPPPYDPELLATLQGEHSILLSMLQQVREAAKLAHFQDLNAALLRFEMAYRTHQQRKEKQLLPYVERHLQLDPGKTLLRDLSGSGTLTDRSVQGFLRHYHSYPVSDHTLKRFGRELDGVIAELRQRLDTESLSLHSLYLPTHQY
jgi:hypothetical protein